MNSLIMAGILQQQANYSQYGVKTKYLSFTKAASAYAIIDGAAGEAVIDLLHGAGAITVEFYYNQQTLPASTTERNNFITITNSNTCVQIEIRRDSASPNAFFLLVGGRSQSSDIYMSASIRGAYTNTENTWYFCQAEFNFTNGTIKAWIDGTEVISASASWGSTTFVKAASVYSVSLSVNTANQYLTGYLDEVRIWKGTRADIKATRSGWETGLVLFNKLNDGSGSTLTDSSQYGNHGTVSGATFVTL